MRVLVAEDQFLLRQGLVALLTAHGVRVCAEVAIGPEIADAVRATEPDLALLDIRMPPTNTDEGVRAALALRRERPGFPWCCCRSTSSTCTWASCLTIRPGRSATC